MIIKSLRLTDFGAFRGEHLIDLEPREKYGKKRPIILFGGLNGAGKTTILEAVRLTLYGRQAIGKNVSQAEYDTYLQEAIHKSSHLLVNSDSASVSLEFVYSRLGKVSTYTVTRSWTAAKNSVKENLELLRDGQPLSEISNDQTQSFLNELIPIGVSDLFFFDGEKIKSLAEEEGNRALGDSLYRLLGLDLIERLRSDLAIYSRRFQTEHGSAEVLAQLEKYQEEYQKQAGILDNKQKDLGELANTIHYHEKLLLEKESEFSENGGAWAMNRAQNAARLQQLDKQRRETEDDLRNELAGLYPFTFVPGLIKDVEEQLESEHHLKQWQSAETIIQARKPKFINALRKSFPAVGSRNLHSELEDAFSVLLTPPNNVKNISMVHDISESSYLQIRALIKAVKSDAQKTVTTLKMKLESVERELAGLQLQLERTPTEESVSGLFQAIKEEQSIIATLKEKRRALIEEMQNIIRDSLDTLRKSKKLEESALSTKQFSANIHMAAGIRNLLENFVEKIRVDKLRELEITFEKAFSRLARKEDMLLRAKIDSTTFDVELIGKNNKIIQKKKLSAGEKQIYAIAMLEALALTSGRRLPVIIDTPLGRLDSKHRTRLVDNYFPKASHQVIILSTDTEVDKQFYADLTPSISHAYSISYHDEEGASSFSQEYFWREAHKELSHVS